MAAPYERIHYCVAELDGFRVDRFAKEEYTPADSSGPPLFTWREFYGFRNELLGVLQAYGTVGPTGELPILEDWETSEEAWKGGSPEPDFFVVDEMYNEHDRWNRVETSAIMIGTKLLHDLVSFVRHWPGWCVYLSLGPGGLTILRDRILHEGNLFTGASRIAELGKRCESVKNINSST